MCSSAPNTDGMNAAAVASAQISKEALDFYKKQYADEAPAREKLSNKAYEVADQQLASAKANDALAADYADYNKTTFRPLEQSIVEDAANYDTPGKRQAAADSAMADTNMAFAKSNEATARSMAANGINPGSARAMSVTQGQGVDQATANAGAAFRARKGVETVGHAMKMDASSLGRGLASSQATSAQVALSAGNNAVANTGVPISASNQAAQIMGQGYSTALSGQQAAGSLYGQQAQIQGSANNNSAWGALGNVAGQFAGSKTGSALIGGWMSDENVKTDIEPITDEEALAATNATPVMKWRYDPAKMAAKGVEIPRGMEGENVGPMAQDVNANMGEAAAPGGETLNPVVMNGLNMKSIQAVDKKVVQLTKQVGSLAKLIQGGKIQAGGAV